VLSSSANILDFATIHVQFSIKTVAKFRKHTRKKLIANNMKIKTFKAARWRSKSPKIGFKHY